ncbi:hypothetical protein IC232_28925 [Microvirga sp. BT688]|uniref:hypothetical protein n=1 Tax=Microvirga sp. TaxID=1873136 RepID=UPI00168998B7|nr:hypothetical protein [Microvirga sp.]MBD2750674.1 hypothetical protein [Microvirga sp.]
MNAVDIVVENQAWTPDVTLGLLRRFINGSGLNAECARFLQNIADAENEHQPTAYIQVEPKSVGRTLRLSVDLSFGDGTVDGHHVRMSVRNVISHFAAEGAMTPYDYDHATLESWSVTVTPRGSLT